MGKAEFIIARVKEAGLLVVEDFLLTEREVRLQKKPYWQRLNESHGQRKRQ